MTNISDLPVATLAYRSSNVDDGWWAAAKIVGRMCFWYGALRLATLIIQLGGGAVVMGQSRWLTVSGIAELALAFVFVLASAVGAVFTISGGQGVARGRTASLRLLSWGMILSAAAAILQVVQSAVQIMGLGTLPSGLHLYYLAQTTAGAAASLVLPIFIVYFVSRPELRRTG